MTKKENKQILEVLIENEQKKPNMIITNDIEENFKELIKKHTYHKNTKYSVTQILGEPRPVILQNRYSDEIERTAEDALWSFFGTAFHSAMEDLEDDYSLLEERIKDGDVSGKFDFYNSKNKTLYDYKFLSYWTVIYKDGLVEYQKQLSIYAYLLRKEGFEVDKIKNVIFFRDWKKSDIKRGVHNFEKPFVTVEYKILDEIDGMDIQTFLKTKAEEFDKYEKYKDENLPFCTEEYRWAKPDTYKVKKYGVKKSYKNFENKEDAEDYVFYLKEQEYEKYLKQEEKREEAKKAGKKLPTKYKQAEYYVEHVINDKFKRCEYCPVADFCNQYKATDKYKKENGLM